MKGVIVCHLTKTEQQRKQGSYIVRKETSLNIEINLIK